MSGAFHRFAEALLEAGYSPLPVVPGQKKPALKEWSNFCAAPMTRARARRLTAQELCISYRAFGPASDVAGVASRNWVRRPPEERLL